MMAYNGLEHGIKRAARSDTFERLARAGHVVSGVLHLLIGYLAISVAFGSRENIDQSGALATLADKPGGRIALWLAVAGFVALGLWRLVESVWGGQSAHTRDNSRLDRAKALALAATFFALAYSATGFAMGSGKSSGQRNAALSARLMQSFPGKTVLIMAGFVIVAVGAYHLYKGATQGFCDDLRGYQRGITRGMVKPLGVVGYLAKGLVLTGVGVLVIVASVRADPAEATGLDGALKALGAQPFGAVLLVIAGLGIITYGLYSFVMARYAKM